MKLSYKLAGSLGLIILLFIGSGFFTMNTMNKLGLLQDEGPLDLKTVRMSEWFLLEWEAFIQSLVMRLS